MRGFCGGVVAAIVAILWSEPQNRTWKGLKAGFAYGPKGHLTNYLSIPGDVNEKTAKLLLSQHIISALFAAFKLGVFEAISAASPQGVTCQELAHQLEVSVRGLDALLITLVSEGFVTADPTTSRLTCQPDGGLHRHNVVELQGWFVGLHRQLYHFADSVKSGKAEGLHAIHGQEMPSLYIARAQDKDKDLAKYWDPWMQEQNFPEGLAKMVAALMDHASSMQAGGKFMLLDWCGNRGYNSILLAETYPNLYSVLLDLPSQTAQADVLIQEKGLEARIETLPANLLENTFAPPAAKFDGVLMTHTIREWREDQLQAFFRMIHGSLKPGGAVVLDMLSLRRPGAYPESTVPVGVAEAYFLASAADDQHEHHKDDVIAWLAEAGFKDFLWIDLPGHLCGLGSLYMSQYCNALLARRA